MSDRRANIELLLKTLKEAYTDLALLKADLDDVEAKNRAKAERVKLDRKLNNENVKRRNRLDHNSQSTLPPKRDVPSSAPKRPVGRDASGAPNIGTERAARQKIEADKQPTVVRGTGIADAKAKAKSLKVVKGDVVDMKTKEVISTDHKPAPKKLVNNQHRPSYKDTLNHIKNSGSLEVKPAPVKAKSKAKDEAKVAKAERKPKAIKKAGAGGTKEDYEFGGKYTASGHLMQAGKAVGNMVSGMFGGSTVEDSVNAKGAKTTAAGGNAPQQADAGKARTDQE